jgi:hypothetical protein
MKIKDAARRPTGDLTALGRRVNHPGPREGLDGRGACRGHARARAAIKRSIAVAFFVPPALSLTIGCTSGAKPPAEKATATPLHVAGAVALAGRHVDFNTHRGDNECVGTGAFSDLTKGAEVRISDATGKTLAVTRLGMGLADTTTTDLAAGVCDFLFDAAVPTDKGSYTIQVTHHGNQTFGEKQMANPKLYLG